MATSKLMASSSTSQTSDIRRKASPSSSSTTLPAFFHNQQYASKSQGDDSNPDSNLMTLDRFLENVYADDQAAAGGALLSAGIARRDVAGDTEPVGESPANAPVVRKTVEDVWREIVEGKRLQQKEAPTVECKEEEMDEMMTLEDFLVKAGAVDEPAVAAGHGEVKIEPDGERFSGGSFMFDSPILGTPQHSMEDVVGFGNVMEASGSGRAKRRAILEPLDKAALQRQRRMIKNRESAARSRERKQAYQVELESMAVKLEEENEQLLREQAERTKERFKQLMEKVIPVTEKRRPPRALRRVNSM
ncbi:G-box-binding factor 4-like [Ipomoea triloba]|uniref:G-box-binding factor 4-like n=1 Tax=Ipomoea triloba TaxID=35885 RepID=UPI00125E33F5|nr:G-box-binding factor 4-like [Ipomoea triloba]